MGLLPHATSAIAVWIKKHINEGAKSTTKNVLGMESFRMTVRVIVIVALGDMSAKTHVHLMVTKTECIPMVSA
jgi:hypothetical protein